jgi:hypothetical protein
MPKSIRALAVKLTSTSRFDDERVNLVRGLDE